MFFSKKEQNKDQKKTKDSLEAINIQSTLGRQQTSIETARIELYEEPIEYDPLMYIDINKGEFFGMCKAKDEYYPIYVPQKAINHRLYVGITRSGKGIMAGIKCVETLAHEGRGLMYFDVKQEDYTPQIIKEELERQGREDDLIIVTWPNDFCYSGISNSDSILQLWEKMNVALNFTRSDNPGVEHYRSNQRMTLLKLLSTCLGRFFQADWIEIMEFVRCLRQDYLKYEKLEEELQKSKQNVRRIASLKQRYFDQDLLDELDFTPKNIEALEVIYISIFELTMGANVYNGVDISEALYNGKVIYFKCDMENESSLQFLKVIFKDISQKVRQRKADCDVYADEVSFYATKELSGNLSTMAGFGVRYTLQLQDLAQLNDPIIKNSILTNCSAKLFYKVTDIETLKYVETLGGNEYISIASLHGAAQEAIRRDVEALVNSTRVRAMWYMQHAVLIAEYFNTAAFITTFPVQVENVFDWDRLKMINRQIERKTFSLKSIEDGSSVSPVVHPATPATSPGSVPVSPGDDMQGSLTGVDLSKTADF